VSKTTNLDSIVVITVGLLSQKNQELLEAVRWMSRPATFMSTKISWYTGVCFQHFMSVLLNLIFLAHRYHELDN